MSNREVEFYIVDMFIAYDKIKRYSKKFINAQDFLHSELEWDAVIRELEIIGEATNQLLKANMLNKEYRIIVDFRNQITHGYFGVDENIVWEVVNNYLDEFRLELLNMIKSNSIDIQESIKFAKIDNNYSEKTTILLNNLYDEVKK